MSVEEKESFRPGNQQDQGPPAAAETSLQSGGKVAEAPSLEAQVSRPPSESVADMNMADMGRKRCAENNSPMFYSGDEALREVAKAEGKWCWALVGPDAENLQLSAGGSGPVEDMQEALGNHPCLFGLLRMSFAHEKGVKVKHIFIQASNTDDEDAGFTGRQRGQAMSKGSKMEEIIKKIVNTNVKIEITSTEECTLPWVIRTLQKVVSGFEANIVTEENFHKAKELEKEKLKAEQPELAQQIEEQEEIEKVAEEMPPPPIEEPVIELEPSTEVEQEASTQKQRKSIKQMYRVGDQVEVWSIKTEKWIIDGEVADLTDESCVRDNVKVRAGSMKIVYGDGKRFKWLMPHQFDTQLRESLRPRPPARLIGQLHKETHNWQTAWHARYFELNRGFLQWWVSEKDYKDKKNPQKVFSLLGVHMEEPQGNKTSFKVQSAATKGVLYSFDGKAPEESRKWIEAIWEHSEYCEELKELTQAKAQGTEVRRELVASLAKRRVSRKSIRGLKLQQAAQ